MRHATPEPHLAALARRTLLLLQRVRPEREEGDVLWFGPYFLPRSGQWWPTRFLLFKDELYCGLEMGWSTVTLVWRVSTDEVAFENQTSFDSGYRNGPELWALVLDQVEHRLRGAVTHPEAYNRRVARLLPVGCRTGRILRKLTWPSAARAPLSRRDRERLERALKRAKSARSWRSLNVHRYLDVVALAYGAVFDELKKLAPREQYERKADRRHGGMLDLPLEDSRAFERWHSSTRLQGAHPWEIVFAHPHGVLLSPGRSEGSWRFYLAVDTPGLYGSCARMATALGEGGVPFELLRAPDVIAALRGEDTVEVGPFYDQLSLEELEDRRKGASTRVVWDAPPVLVLRSPERRPK